MVRPVETIRKDLDALEGATTVLAEEFSKLYSTYLTTLGSALRRQVIMATYHLCTQVYPKEFLALSVSDRGRLQQEILALGRKAQDWLQQTMEPKPVDAEGDTSSAFDSADLNRLEAALVALVRSSADDAADSGEAEPGEGERDGEAAGLAMSVQESPEEWPDAMRPGESLEADTESSPKPELLPELPSEMDPKRLMQSVLRAAMASELEEAFRDRPFTGDPITPSLVAKHHLMVEQLMRAVLRRVSKQANRLLCQAKILPDLPEALIEMASEADIGVPRGRSVPNVLNVMVAMSGEVAAEFDPSQADLDEDDSDEDDSDEDEDDRDDEMMEGNMTHLAAINLRLADLEFGDVQSALWRSKLRTAVGRLRKLGKQYQQAEGELAISQAEQAWRAVWYDDSAR
jgi:hypothetical protein